MKKQARFKDRVTKCNYRYDDNGEGHKERQKENIRQLRREKEQARQAQESID